MNKRNVQIVERTLFLESLITKLESQLQNAPIGRVRITKRGSSTEYYFCSSPSERNGKYVRKDEDSIIKSVIQKDYDKAVLKSAKSELSALQMCLKRLPQYDAESIYENFSQVRQTFITPIILSDEEYLKKWNEESYAKKIIKDGTAAFRTSGNDLVRSKSEVFIADLLQQANIPYHYEKPLVLFSDPSRSSDTITLHPDFTVLNLHLRKTLYWEHFGMMDDPDYCNNAIRKINLYAKNGMVSGEQMIYTFESQKYPLTPDYVRQIISVFLKNTAL